MDKILKQISEERKKNQISDGEIMRKCKISRNTLRSIKYCNGNPTFKHIIAYCRAINIKNIEL